MSNCEEEEGDIYSPAIKKTKYSNSVNKQQENNEEEKNCEMEQID
jgi:hypothetical protein